MSMSRLSWLVALTVLASSVSSAQAATYSVSPTGADANSGTTASPWRTIQRCVDALAAGDTCVIADGSYAEDVKVTRSGAEGRLLHVRAEHPLRAMLKGSFNVTGSYVELSGLHVSVPDRGTFGIRLTGGQSHLTGNAITTQSTNLGLNNVGLGIAGTGNRVTGNRADSVCFGITISGSGHTVEGNTVTALRQHTGCGDVDYMRFFGSNHVIRGNSFFGNKKADLLDAHVDCFQTFDNNGTQFSVTNVIVENNFCADAAQGMMLEAKLQRQSRGLIVRNNVFTRCSSWCVNNHDIADVRFYNNTCDTTGGIHGMWCRGRGNSATCEFKNNIFYGSGTKYGVLETATLIDGTQDAPGTNNVVFDPTKTLTGFANDVINRDPLFVDQLKGDYRLQASSPARGAARPIATWLSATDQQGIPRPRGTWDAGALEYVAPPEAPTAVRVVP